MDKVIKWQGPIKLGDFQAADVTYQCKIEGLADWATKPEFLAVFPDAGKICKEQQQRNVELTSAGWEAKPSPLYIAVPQTKWNENSFKINAVHCDYVRFLSVTAITNPLK